MIPIHIRTVDWQNAPFSKLQALPTGAKPVSEWTNRDKAYYDICVGIKKVVGEFLGHPQKSQAKQAPARKSPSANGSSFAAMGQTLAAPQPRKRLPPIRYELSPSERIKQFLSNFSFRALKQRSRGYMVVLFFVFGVLDLLVFPYFIGLWTTLPVLGFFTCLFMLALFAIGACSKHNAIGVITAFLFFLPWTAVGMLFLPGYYHLTAPPLVIFLTSFLAHCFA